MRPASFLPSITCSDCGNQIEIAAMGEHICEKSPASAKPAAYSDNPYTLGNLGMSDSAPSSPPHNPNYTTQPALPVTRVRAPTLGASDAPISKPMRPPPPRINPDAANMPFLAPNSSMARSPISPALSTRSAGSTGRMPAPLRSATSPMPRRFDVRPPSPELTGGYDCAFPPFYPGQPISRPSTSNGHMAPGERAASRGGLRAERPTTALGGSSNGSRKGSNGQMLPPLTTTLSNDRRPSETCSARPGDDPFARPPTASSFRSQPEGQKREPPQRPARPQQEVLSPTFMDSFSQEPIPHISSTSNPPIPLRNTDRSNTLPLLPQSHAEDSPRSGIFRASTEPMSSRKNSIAGSAAGSVVSTDSHTHSNFGNGSRLDRRLQDAPPVPKAVQEHRQESSHVPSQSSSSNGSKHSYADSSVGGPSPSTSAASSFDAFSPLRAAATPPYGDEEQMRVAGLTFKPTEKLSLQTERKSPPRNFARPRQDVTSPGTPPTMPAALRTPEESPVDPEYRARVSHNQPWNTDFEIAQPAALKANTSPRKTVSPPPTKPAPPPKSDSDFDPYRTAPPSPMGGPPQIRAPPPPFPSANSHAQPQTPSIRRPNTPSTRPICRGCNKSIEGKSVKAADGRLTGRWHKQCFTCRTCAQPFATADFYVIDNQPFCEHHYHEANGSLCAGCHRGIEGQYLETTSTAESRGGLPIEKKFHPTCFTCVDCKLVLSDDYFEIKGRVYCERHALAAMRSQPRRGGGPRAGPGGYRGPPPASGPGGLSAPVDRRGLMAERRTTRLMVM
jgi:hypothetical protein